MKLYVWSDPYDVRYGSSLVFAVAADLREARKVAKSGKAWTYGKFPNDYEKVTQTVLGKPDRVLSLPCAEWHEWCE